MPSRPAMITYSTFRLQGVLVGVDVKTGAGRAGVALEIRGGGAEPWLAVAAPSYGPLAKRLHGQMVAVSGTIATGRVRGQRQTLVVSRLESLEQDTMQEDLPPEMGADLGWIR